MNIKIDNKRLGRKIVRLKRVGVNKRKLVIVIEVKVKRVKENNWRDKEGICKV